MRSLTPLVILLASLAPRSAPAQSNFFDLRAIEVDAHGDVVYQNFIYAHTFKQGRYMLSGLFLHLPADDYREISGGFGYRFLHLRDVDFYGLAQVAAATDDNYFEPALLALDTTGKLTGSLFFQHYAPLGTQGVHQWLLDPLEIQHTVRGPLSLGASAYAFRPDGGTWLLKLGPKLSLADRYGATEVRVAGTNQGHSVEVQFRRIFVF